MPVKPAPTPAIPANHGSSQAMKSSSLSLPSSPCSCCLLRNFHSLSSPCISSPLCCHIAVLLSDISRPVVLGVGSMPLLLPVNVSVEVGDSRSIFAPCHACNTSRHGEAAEAGGFFGCAWSAVGVEAAVRILDSRASRASASRRALSHWAMWLRLAAALADLSSSVPVRAPLVALWVTGSIPILASLFLRCDRSGRCDRSECICIVTRWQTAVLQEQTLHLILARRKEVREDINGVATK